MKPLQARLAWIDQIALAELRRRPPFTRFTPCYLGHTQKFFLVETVGIEPTSQCLQSIVAPLVHGSPEIGARGRIQTGVIRGLQSRAYSLCHSCLVFIWQQCQDLNLKYVSQSHVCCQLHHTAIFNWSWRVGLNHQHRFYENRILPIKLLHGFGAGGESRTHNIWDLNPARLPIAPHLLKLVASPRFELGKSCF